jgi:hypothetical protein
MIKTKIQITGPDITEFLMLHNDYYQDAYDWAKEFLDKNLVLNVCQITMLDKQSLMYEFYSVDKEKAAEYMIHYNDTYPSYPGHTKVMAERIGHIVQISQEEYAFDEVAYNCVIISETDSGDPVLLGQQHPFNLDPFEEILKDLSSPG